MLATVARPGWAVRRSAVAPGVMRSVKISRTPTTWTASATAAASRSRNSTDIRRTGTPRASATIGSTVAKVSGRYMIARPAMVTTDMNASSITSPLVTDVIAPNRRLMASVA